MFPVAILAGGLAKRLNPITQSIPKAMIEVSGKPFILHQLLHLRKQKIKKIVLCIGHLGDIIKSTIGDGSKLDLDISYSTDGDNLLGTGGAIKKALPLLGENFFVLYGDTYLPIRFDNVQKAYLSNSFLSLMTVFKNNGRFDKSNVFYKKNHFIKYDKTKPSNDMNYIDYGLSIMNAKTFDKYSDKTFLDLSIIFKKLSEKKQLGGFEVFRRFYEIGNPNSLRETREYFSKFKG